MHSNTGGQVHFSCLADSSAAPGAFTVVPQPRRPGWRHLATLALLCLTLPVWAAAALVSVPVMLIWGAAVALGKVQDLLPAAPQRANVANRVASAR